MEETKISSTSIYETIVAISALTLFGVLFSVTELFKSPFIVFAVILFVLYPFKKSKLIKIIISISSIIFLLWFLHSISNILIPFIIAFLLAYILNPLVEYLTTKKLSRALSSILIILLFVALIIVALIFLVPIIVNQFTEFIKTLPQALNDFKNWATTVIIPKLGSWGIPTEDINNKIANEIPGKLEKILNGLLGGLSGIFAGLSIVLSQLINIILIPFLTFYILKDFDNLKDFVKTLFPHKNRDKAVSYFHKIDDVLGRFMRGALTVALINAILVSIFLSLIGVRYSIFIGALAGLLDLIPYFGLLISLVIGLIVAFFSGDASIQVPLTLLTFIGLNILETSYLAPKIIGGKIGLHPALLILSLLVFSYFFGFLGLLIALPTTSIIILFFNEWLDRRKDN